VVVKAMYAMFLLYNIIYCRDMLELRYFPKESRKYLIVDSQDLVGFFRWFNWDYPQHYGALETIKPYLLSVGIKPEDKIISMPDQSINITLYLMDRKGFSNFGYDDLQGDARIKTFIDAGAKFLIINDAKLLEEEYLKPYLKNKIGEYKNITIYNLQNI
jgi:hypothetical protein